MIRALSRIRDGIEAIIDTILPLRPRSARTKTLRPEDVPISPASHELLGTTIVTLVEYRKKTVQDMIQSLKYDGGGHAARLCASVLAEYLIEEVATEKNFSAKRILLVPVPLHASRARERGFNQIELVLRALPSEYRDGTITSLVPNVLVRSRETAQQTRLSRQERLSNVAGAFTVPHQVLVENAHVILIDDVVTTGATLANAATPLRRAGAKVTLLALARA